MKLSDIEKILIGIGLLGILNGFVIKESTKTATPIVHPIVRTVDSREVPNYEGLADIIFLSGASLSNLGIGMYAKRRRDYAKKVY